MIENRSEIYNKIRQHYEYATPKILEAAKVKMWFTPYSDLVDWPKLMTPIEFNAWQAIRCYGSFPLYPQYPVGNRFADFGNPFFKVAVECDGKDFHMDKEKDRVRDEYFKKVGWSVYRISGSDCVRFIEIDFEAENTEEMFDKFYRATIEGLIKSLAVRYCKNVPYQDYEEPMIERCLKSRLSI